MLISYNNNNNFNIKKIKMNNNLLMIYNNS